jgi:ABC-type enterochelin transport system substrate-binding protein
MCKKILEARNDEDNIKNIWVTNKAKKDDLCDTVMQCLSYVVNQVLSSSGKGESKTKTKTKSEKVEKTKAKTKAKKKSSNSGTKTVKKRTKKVKAKSPTKLDELNKMLGL